ncbi:MAG: phosphoribosylformylglycinamidine synthase subunit PurQ, partial [Clostridia bacterium]|nr:phosphoribosylformylglycinamidine synthase subunit PurQ [Clostridia bacterium]
VPPTLVSFAVTTEKCTDIVSPEFKAAGHKVVVIAPEYDENNLPVTESLLEVFNTVTELTRSKKCVACYTLGLGGVAEAVLKMAIGNSIGFDFEASVSMEEIFGYGYGSFVLELAEDVKVGKVIGKTVSEEKITYNGEELDLGELLKIYEEKLEPVFSCNIKTEGKEIKKVSFERKESIAPAIKVAKPKVLIPVFPGTNCEYDSARAAERAGLDAETVIIRNLTASAIAESTEYFAKKLADSQIVFIPGGFSGGDEPEGSGKFITAFFRSPEIKDGVMKLLRERDGLMCGICNGFQALIKLGLVPYGEIIDTDASCPTLTFNTIGRHQSRIVHTRVASNKSPWMSKAKVGEIYTVPISHGEGRFIASEDLVKKLADNGQILTQYVDLNGNPTDDIRFNPNNSVWAIEGITSPDGRVLGKMGHSERVGDNLYRNVEGNYNLGLFDSAFEYYK